jgi:uncharacterized protein (DUF362 family)/ferredoxin
VIQSYGFNADNIIIARPDGIKEIKDMLRSILSQKRSLLPQSKEGIIVIKPNLNNDLNALMGNSTDLRILTIVIEWIKENGYKNIFVADGYNVGVNRRNINVCKRLRIDRLVKLFGIKFLNLNDDKFREVRLGNHKVKIAKTCIEADFFINLPKIKTHSEANMSLALKNMIGCVVGQEKRKIHRDLAGNIVRLNEILKPDLHIVDGLIIMEGNGPGDGSPRRLDLLIIGTNPFLIDLVCAKLVGFNWQEIKYLVVAKEKGYITDKDIKKVERDISTLAHIEKASSRGILAKFSDQRSLYWLKVLMRPITSLPLVTELAYKLNIVQDVYNLKDDEIENVSRNKASCDSCGKCAEYCPMGIETEKIGQIPPHSDCINCLYCFFVCPNKAIELKGKAGFLTRYIEKYEKKIRQVVGNND